MPIVHQSLAAANDVCRRKHKQVAAASTLFPFGLRRVHWRKEASSLGCVTPHWTTPAINPICQWIMGTTVERRHGPRSVTSLLVFIQQGLKRLSPHENPSLMRVRTMI